MSRRTVMAGSLGPSSLRSTPRDIYVCVPDHIGNDDAERVSSVLSGLVRAGDRLLYSGTRPPSHHIAVGLYASALGLDIAQMRAETAPPNLVIVILDPLGDNESAIQARADVRGAADIVIAELPDPAR